MCKNSKNIQDLGFSFKGGIDDAVDHMFNNGRKSWGPFPEPLYKGKVYQLLALILISYCFAQAALVHHGPLSLCEEGINHGK